MVAVWPEVQEIKTNQCEVNIFQISGIYMSKPNTKEMSKVGEMPVITHKVQGAYSYETHYEPELEFQRYIGDESIEEWIEHVFQPVRPYAKVRLTVEVME